MKYIISLITILIVLTIDVHAQNDKRQYYSYGQGFYYQTFLQEGRSSDSINVLVQFRIVYDAISFTKNAELKQYEGIPEIELSFKNKGRIIKSRIIWRDTLFLDDYKSTISKERYVLGSVSVDLPKDNYSVNIELSSNTNKIRTDYSLELPKVLDNKNIYDFMFTHTNPEAAYDLQTCILNNNLDFSGKPNYIVLSPNRTYNQSALKFELKKINDELDDWTSDFWTGDIMVTSNVKSLSGKMINSIDNEAIVDNGPGLLYIDLENKGLIPGEYLLKVSNGNDTIFKKDFNVKWYNKPYSLREIEYAMPAMKYILTEDAYDEMYEGSDNEVWQKFLAYWDKLDPNPETKFNDVMNEFYKRVDHAYFNYQTTNASDGSKTDRGKIYILNGKPSSVKRKMAVGTTKETWVYNNIKKAYYFEAKKAGVYKLVRVKDIN